ncbi:10971_t:CDS:1, partial [Cetraspora pellucida]
YLSQYKDDESFSQNQMASAIYNKLESYWPLLDETSQISSLLDLRTKLTAFRTMDEKIKAIDTVSNLEEYSPQVPEPTTVSSNDLSTTQNYFCQLRLTDSTQENNSNSPLPMMN